MSQVWKSFTSLRLNGLIYSRLELFALSYEKLENSETPEWEKEIFRFIIEWLNEKDKVIVHTSGSTGKPKNLEIEKERMLASAQATNSFFSLDESNKALLCLSAEYIAGKMMIVRAFVGGFNLEFSEPKSDALLKLNSDFDFIAVVPMQLESVCKSEASRALSRVKKLIVGGAALRQDLMQELEQVETEVWATYGMTETITHIALQRLNGIYKIDYFQALQNVYFQVDERECLCVLAPDVNAEEIVTNDRVELINYRQFRFLGRVDFVINSGGIKLSPEILEQKLETYIANNFSFSSKPDAVLGEKLILVIEGEDYSEKKSKELDAILKNVFNRFELPKEIVYIKELPKTGNGKLDRIQLKEII